RRHTRSTVDRSPWCNIPPDPSTATLPAERLLESQACASVTSYKVQEVTGEFAQSIVTSWLGFAGLTATLTCAPRRRLATFACGTRFMKTASIGLEPSIGSSALNTYTGSLGSGWAGSISPTVFPDGENSRRTAVIRWPLASSSAAERRCPVFP